MSIYVATLINHVLSSYPSGFCLGLQFYSFLMYITIYLK